MRQEVIFSVLCLLIVLGALGFTGWTLASGQIHKHGIDALFLVALYLLIVVMLAPIPVRALRRGELHQWLQSAKHRGTKAGAKESGASADSESSEKMKQHSV